MWDEDGAWRLPTLEGRWLTIYSALWLATLAGAVFAAVLPFARPQWNGLSELPDVRLGLMMDMSGEGPPPIVDASLAARAAGARPGDRVLAIDGARVGPGLKRVWTAPEGAPFVLELKSADGAERRVTLRSGVRVRDAMFHEKAWSLPAVIRGFAAIEAVQTLLFAAAAVLLFLRRRSNPVAALLGLAPLIGTTFGGAHLSADVQMASGGITAGMLMLGLAGFPDGRFHGPLGKGLFLAILGWTTLGIIGVVGDLELPGWPTMALLGLVALTLMLRTRGLADAERQQLRWALMGFALAGLVFAVGAALELRPVDPSLRGYIRSVAIEQVLGLLMTLFFAGGLLIALLRFRLYDADVVLTRSAVWAFAAPALAFAFATLVELAKKLMESVGGESGAGATAAAGVATAMLIRPVSHWVTHRIERWSRRNLLALTREVPEAAMDMAEADDDEALAAYAARRIRTALKARQVAIVAPTPQGWRALASDGVSVATVLASLREHALPDDCRTDVARDDPELPLRVPLVARPRGVASAVGWALIGPRPDGSVQDRDARSAVEEVAPALGRALLRIEARREREGQLIDRVERAFARRELAA